MNKSLVTNLLATLMVVTGWLLPAPWHDPVLTMGLFALAGGLTNWLAIHMLFEKVPGLYGSGVIAAKFDAFRQAIEKLVMQQFFAPQQIERYIQDLQTHEVRQLDLSAAINAVDLTPAWDSLVDTIKQSSFAGMLSMFGGDKALQPLKDPFIRKLQDAIESIAQSEDFQQHLRQQTDQLNLSTKLHQQISLIVQMRLAELTPEMVKNIISQMIRQHMGWLVIWGGVFGGLIGLLSSFIVF